MAGAIQSLFTGTVLSSALKKDVLLIEKMLGWSDILQWPDKTCFGLYFCLMALA